VLLLASGKLGNSATASLDDFQRALDKLCRELAWMIVRDGEGAIRVMELEVTGAKTDRDAKLAAHAIATSPLVKTALHGGDPNWGRILAAVGRSGARFSLRKISLHAGNIALVLNGAPAPYREKEAAKVFARERVPLHVHLGNGTARTVVLSSDLGHDYVSLNADYRS
jgi:glutamate N-acetyltransferase/amino-acid N-acetyltransferase